MTDLMDIIFTHASRKFGWVVETQGFLNCAPEGGWDQYSLNTYSFAAMSCVADVQRWCIKDKSPQFESVKFIFEAGDGNGQEHLRQNFNALNLELEFGLKKDTETQFGTMKPTFTPLQAPDVPAYETLKVCKALRVGNIMGCKPRWAMKEFQRMQGEVKIATPTVIIESAKQAKKVLVS